MDNFLTFNYWFALQSGGQFAYYNYTLYTSAFLLVLAVGIYIAYKVKFYKSPYKKILRSASSWLLFFGLATAFLTFFRLENAILLSMRIWFVLLGLGFIVWLLLTLRAIVREQRRLLLREKLKEIKKEKLEGKKEEKQKLERYLPKKGKKKKKKK